MPAPAFVFPVFFDYAATFFWALSGVLVAWRRGYDVAGAVTIALVSAAGGGLLRDGLLLNRVPPSLLVSPAYFLLILLALGLAYALGPSFTGRKSFRRADILFDALGMGGFAVVGMQLATAAQLHPVGVAFVGVVNAVGGGLLRDVLMNREPAFFKPGELMALAVLAGCAAYLALTLLLGWQAFAAGWATVLVVTALRGASLKLGWRTRALSRFGERSPED